MQTNDQDKIKEKDYMNIIINPSFKITYRIIQIIIVSFMIISLFISNLGADYFLSNNVSIELSLKRSDINYDLSYLTQYHKSESSVKIIIIDTQEDLISPKEDNLVPDDHMIPVDDSINVSVVQWPWTPQISKRKLSMIRRPSSVW